MNIALDRRITISVREAMAATGIGLTMMYELMNSRSIRTIKVGKKRLIIVESIYEWIAANESHNSDQSGGK